MNDQNPELYLKILDLAECQQNLNNLKFKGQLFFCNENKSEMLLNIFCLIQYFEADFPYSKS